MNSTTNMAITIAQPIAIVARPSELSLTIARLERRLQRTAGLEQDQVLDRLILLYRKRAVAFDLGAA